MPDNDLDLPALREAAASIAACAVPECGRCDELRRDLADAAPALLDEVERLRHLDKYLSEATADPVIEHLESDLATERELRVIAEAGWDKASALLKDAATQHEVVLADLTAARAVLDSAKDLGPDEWLDRRVLVVDNAAWLAWQERRK